MSKQRTDQILELKKKVKFLEEEAMRHSLFIHNLQKATGTHPEDFEKDKDETLLINIIDKLDN